MHRWTSTCVVSDSLMILCFIILFHSDDYATKINNTITQITHNVSYYQAAYIVEDSGTSHISVLDASGMSVAVTTYVIL